MKLANSQRSWSPPIEDWVPLKKSKNSNLRMATLVGDRLHRGLVFEGEVLPINKNNWRQVFSHARPDIFLVESVGINECRYSDMAAASILTNDEYLISIIRSAQQNAIPTIFWLTHDHESCQRYLSIAKYYDLVCCADPRAVATFASHNIKASLLLPCVQPALYNPFCHFEFRDAMSLGVLFDGWADLCLSSDSLKVMQNIKNFGLNIIESRVNWPGVRLDVLPEYDSFILGRVSTAGRLIALKYAEAYVTHATSLSSPIELQWQSLEAAASRLPVVHYGEFEELDIRHDFVVGCTSESDLLIEFVRYQEDNLYRERVAHLGWRAVNAAHTFAHRLNSICKLLGVTHDWIEYPKASLVFPTYRRELVHRCYSTYREMNYPSKEMVLVFNGDIAPTYEELGMTETDDSVTIVNVPSDNFAGGVLNYGHFMSSGDYIFRIDDDDYYGLNYIGDMILLARAVDAQLFGKPPVPLKFEGQPEIYKKETGVELTILPQVLMKTNKIWLGGNSVSGTSSFFALNPYFDSSYGAADTAMVMGMSDAANQAIACMDSFNLVAERRENVTSHTWKMDRESLVKGRRTYSDVGEFSL